MDDIKELSDEIFDSAMDYLPRLIDGLSRASDHFKKNENLNGFQILSDANEGLTWFNEVVLGLPVILPQGDNVTDIKTSWQPYMEALNSILESIENKDTHSVGQLLENEIVPFIRLVFEKISNLKPGTQYTQ
ncbi:hypothetical protein L9W92_07940 [Pelotomaculum terephthalicicum JT]|uniref:hypothetical protein n=1 Tax=Pelotomaculum TaxID=191373 RepID=UPI0009CFC8A4|nr:MULTISPECIES: hypothetical protein [Pelotomaculum]MCG9967986.1 hypothetical protein [Pelotomaculum terephthalicicum JT]OPX88586.1 MAG: hypothetical protein A4E54_01307 [Pelotomaculum sp. PtaB.Bin117]OPY63041.1 MAG: hypothetical protein A4E56_00871 [Pelotomaculum sp. PtaU1.Bin065]